MTSCRTSYELGAITAIAYDVAGLRRSAYFCSAATSDGVAARPFVAAVELVPW